MVQGGCNIFILYNAHQLMHPFLDQYSNGQFQNRSKLHAKASSDFYTWKPMGTDRTDKAQRLPIQTTTKSSNHLHLLFSLWPRP